MERRAQAPPQRLGTQQAMVGAGMRARMVAAGMATRVLAVVPACRREVARSGTAGCRWHRRALLGSPGPCPFFHTPAPGGRAARRGDVAAPGSALLAAGVALSTRRVAVAACWQPWQGGEQAAWGLCQRQLTASWRLAGTGPHSGLSHIGLNKKGSRGRHSSAFQQEPGEGGQQRNRALSALSPQHASRTASKTHISLIWGKAVGPPHCTGIVPAQQQRSSACHSARASSKHGCSAASTAAGTWRAPPLL